jgi:tetratricopeptide (TPR) repeat protein
VTSRDIAGTAGIVAVAASLLAGAAELQAVRERRYPPAAEETEESLYLQSGTAARRMAGAYASLASDLYWIRAIQHYGATKLRLTAAHRLGPEPPPLIAAPPDEYKLLYPLLNLTTSLDPRFNIAYRFGSVFLAEPYPAGPGRPDLAIALLEKGLRENPNKWEYMEDIGFVHYWYDHDYRAAAEWFQKASEVPGAPWWLRSLAATTLAQGGDRQSSKLMWEAIRQSAEIEWLRHDAERRLLQLRALDDMDALQRAVDDYTRRAGQPPADWNALVRAGVIPGVPLDPGRTPYQLGTNGRVGLSRSSSLYPLPTEPARQMASPAS